MSLKQIQYNPIFEISNTLSISRIFLNGNEDSSKCYIPEWIDIDYLLELIESINENNKLLHDERLYEYLDFFDFNFPEIPTIDSEDHYEWSIKKYVIEQKRNLALCLRLLTGQPMPTMTRVIDDSESRVGLKWEESEIKKIEVYIQQLLEYYEYFNMESRKTEKIDEYCDMIMEMTDEVINEVFPSPVQRRMFIMISSDMEFVEEATKDMINKIRKSFNKKY